MLVCVSSSPEVVSFFGTVLEKHLSGLGFLFFITFACLEIRQRVTSQLFVLAKEALEETAAGSDLNLDQSDDDSETDDDGGPTNNDPKSEL